MHISKIQTTICRKPLVLCVQDIRIQANVGQEGENEPGEANHVQRADRQAGREGEAIPGRGEGSRNRGRRLKNLLAKVLFLGQVCKHENMVVQR